ncbi:MAG: hypothetical protein AB1467_00785 [Candidatus Diapherotrites archaeon]
MPAKKFKAAAEEKSRLRNIIMEFPKTPGVPDEEMAFRVVKLYFEEIARLGFKRRLDLDAIINAYFYALARLERKDKELKFIQKKVLKEESVLSRETKEEMIPEP